MTSPSSPPGRRLVAALVGVALAVGAALATVALARRSDAPASAPLPGDTVLEATVDLARGAVDRRLLAPGPCIFDVDVRAPVAIRVTLGPPAPSTSGAEGGPAPETATEVAGHVNGSTTDRVRVYAAGIQVLRVEPVDPKAGGKAVIRVRRRAGG